MSNKQFKFTSEDIKNGIYTDDSETMICSSCHEHACPTYYIDVNPETGEVEVGDQAGSDCCGAAEPYYD